MRTNYIRVRGLGIMVAIVVAVAALSGSCVLGTETNLCAVSGLRCKPGQVCAANQEACIDIGGCGDAVISGEETCDDGNIIDGDGCSADCKSDESCGNGVLDLIAGETCDDGNKLPGDSCTPECVLATCSNRAVDVNEDCDAGGVDSPGCDYNCTFVECGDGYANAAADEECDDGALASPTCNSPILCTMSKCGDSYFNSMAGEECDTGGDSPACNGNNIVDGKGSCQIPACGDGYKNPEFVVPGSAGAPEACDTEIDTQTCNGNGNPDGLANCQVPRCGDQYVNPSFTPPGGWRQKPATSVAILHSAMEPTT